MGINHPDLEEEDAWENTALLMGSVGHASGGHRKRATEWPRQAVRGSVLGESRQRKPVNTQIWMGNQPILHYYTIYIQENKIRFYNAKYTA